MPKLAKKETLFSDEEIMKLTRAEVTEPLSNKEIAFAENFIIDNNSKLAAIRAGYSVGSGSVMGCKISKKKTVATYIRWLKLKLYTETMLKAEEIISMYAKIAFNDATNFYDVAKDGSLILKPKNELDGQVIQEVRYNDKSGVTIKFADRMKALEKLEQFLPENKYDYKRKLDEKRLQLLTERLELEKAKLGMSEQIQDDGFIEALEAASLTNDFNDIIEEETSNEDE